MAPVAAEPVKAIPVPKSITKRLEPSTVVGIAYPKGAKGDYVKGRRGRIKRTVDVTPELVQHTLKMIREGSGMVAIAKEFNVNPAELSVALKEAGLVLQRGRPRKE